ncbi:MAG: hypothetical protein P8J91_03530 [Pirellulaceae bacterium]|nr:hypothetical protein [Pirellulaceae bacterium]MDG2102797.1 hypothetical protein [Pirellulaceae bacterium]
MARRRKKTWLDRISDFSIISLLINPVTMVICVFVLALVSWDRYQDQLETPLTQPIDQRTLFVNRPPSWIKTDVRKVAIQDSRLEEIQLGEPRALEMVAASFAVQPWVKSVNRIRKTSTGVHVNLQYRKPVALVEIGKNSLYPVDDECVLLDSRDFSGPDARLNYWRVSMPTPITNGLLAGYPWDDVRVSDSVLIANAWNGKQAETGLMRIVNRSAPTRDRLRLQAYELWTLNGTIIIWGNPPGHEVKGEASAEQKIEAVLTYVKKRGSLEKLEKGIYDVRGGTLVRSSAHLASEDAGFVRQTY